MMEFTKQNQPSLQSNSKSISEKAGNILAIDDELGPRESIRMVFKDTHNVFLAEDGFKGIEILKKEDIDVIILDLKMPKINGIETLKKIREIDKDVPVIILTGYGDVDTAKKAIHYGTMEFLSKPFNVEDIVKIVTKAIEGRKTKLRSEKLKEELKELNEQLKERISNMENLATVGQISAEIMHEINNLLTVIHGYTQLLSQQINPDNSSKGYVSTINEEIKRCKEIAKNILELSKNKQTVEKVNINHLIRKIVDFLKISKIAKNIRFNLNLGEGIPLIDANSNHIHQAILNILLNGIEAIGKNRSGIIEIKTEKDKNNIIIKIKDNGPGMPEEVVNKILKPFYTSKEKGTGLGLYITHKLVKKYNGEIKINTQKGEGTEFTLIFPSNRGG